MSDASTTAAGPLRYETHFAVVQLFLAVVVGGAFLFFCIGLPLLSDEEPGGFETFVATCTTLWALVIAGFRRSLVVDRGRGEVVRRMGWFALQRTRRFPLSAYDRVEIRRSTVDHDANRPASERRLSARSTSYPVYLCGEDDAALMVSTSSSHASAAEEAVRVSEYLELPLVDTSSGA